MILFFLPHAGGSAKSYCSFKRFLPASLKVIPMEIAGRSTRSSEPLYNDVSDCCSDLLECHRKSMESEEYAIFGHSMGTLLACELVRQAREKGIPEPKHVFLSGRCSADESATIFSAGKDTSDDEITEFFFSKSLLPKPTAGAEELMAMLSRILCADVRMADRCRFSPEEFRFACDVTVIYGRDDEMLSGFDMHGWQRMTDGSCKVYDFSGGHFYYQEHKEAVCRIITDTLGIN
ncbi:MAG: thioesterase [Ruminococcus sp.]|nr:thioesterase [Ruminococcus sp.]